VFERRVRDTDPGQEAETRAVWKVVFTEVLSLVPSVFQTCVVFDASSMSGEDGRMLSSISLAIVTAILRNMHSAGIIIIIIIFFFFFEHIVFRRK
jgi:hypothetical protein